MIQVTMPQVGFRKHVISGRECDSGNYATSGIQETCNKWERQYDSGNHATSGIQETMSEVGETV